MFNKGGPAVCWEPYAPWLFLVVPKVESFLGRRYGAGAERRTIERDSVFKRLQLDGGYHDCVVPSEQNPAGPYGYGGFLG